MSPSLAANIPKKELDTRILPYYDKGNSYNNNIIGSTNCFYILLIRSY